MKNKISRRINGSLAIYYGVGLIITALGGLAVAGFWIYKCIVSENEFSWWSLFGIIIATAAFGLGGYSLLRTGSEELEG